MCAELCGTSRDPRIERKCRDQLPAPTPVAAERAETQRKVTGEAGRPVQDLHLTLPSPFPPGLQSSKVSSWTKFYILIPRAILPDSTRGWAEMGPHLLFVVGTSRS